MRRLIDRCAGIDVGQALLLVCVRVVNGKGKLSQETRSFGATTPDLLELRDWLTASEVTHVAMESTGVYWKAPYYMLEDEFEVLRTPGAQLRLTDPDGHRYTAFATNTRPGGPHRQLADLELRHRRRARAEDRIRAAKDTGLRNLPLHELDQNRIWQAIVALACEITAWTQMLALTEHPARRWEPKRLRLRLFSLPAAARPSRPRASCCTCPPTHPGPASSSTASTRLRALAAPG